MVNAIPDICHKHETWDICHYEKFQMSLHDKCGEMLHFSTSGMLGYLRFPHMTDGEISNFSRTLFTLFCSNLRAFGWRKIEPKIEYIVGFVLDGLFSLRNVTFFLL